jgi:primosomal protein N'
MIAEVYPIIKLPRKCSYFDYELPVDLHVGVGDLVRVPFKGREVLGVVRGLKDTSEAKRLIGVNSLAKPAYLSAADLARYERIASHLAQSVSSLMHAVFPGTFFEGAPPFVQVTEDSHIGALDIPVLEHCLSEITLNKTLAISGDRDIGFALAHVLRRKREGQMLILLPRERDAELLARYVKLGDSTSLLHGKTSPSSRSRIIESWRTGKLDTLIGTRLASLLPAHKLSTLLILESGNDEHINERRNPRFDAREAAKLLAHDHDANLIVFDALPRLEELMTMPLVKTLEQLPDETVINLGSADELTNEPLLGDSVILGIETALQSQKRVLLFLNRKGVAKRLQCGKCGHIPLCGTCGHVPNVRHDDLVCAKCQTEMWIPAQCPSCGKPKLSLRGIGGAKMVTTLQKLFPTATIGRIEKGNLENPGADILVATEYFFSSYLDPFTAKRFGLVVDLAADIGLHASDFRGAEETARKLHRLLNFAHRQGAQGLIQTWLPEVLRPMLDLPTFVTSELDVRKLYQLPPFTPRIVLSDAKLEELPEELQTLALERDENIELNCDVSQFKQLSDTIKIHYDGPYV